MHIVWIFLQKSTTSTVTSLQVKRPSSGAEEQAEPSEIDENIEPVSKEPENKKKIINNIGDS